SLTIAVNDQSGDEDFSVTFRLAELAEKNVFLGYSPATPADADALKAFLPSDPNAPASAYPTSLPANVANFVPQIIGDGVVVATGSPIGFGNTQAFTMTLTDPDGVHSVQNDLVVGEYDAIGFDLSRIGMLRIEQLAASLQATQDAITNALTGTL